MYGPSFFTGSLIARFGAPRIVATGLVLEAAAATIGLSGITTLHFWATLIVLGVGWNFGFVGASALVLETHLPQERNKVQAFNDFLVFGIMAVGSFSSGQLLANYGWSAVNMVVYPPVLLGVDRCCMLPPSPSGAGARGCGRCPNFPIHASDRLAEANGDFMPSRARLDEFIGVVEAGDHAGAIERYYTEDSSMQENAAPPRVGRDVLVAHERAVLARMSHVYSKAVSSVVEGDRVAIHWIFELTDKSGKMHRVDEVALQEWRGDKIFRERFFYDPSRPKV